MCILQQTMGTNRSQIKNFIAKELALPKTKGLTRQLLVEVICANLRTSLKNILVFIELITLLNL